MEWYRAYHGACSDAKWPIVARKAKVSVGVVVSVWFALLESASQSSERGSVENFDPETVDALYGYDDGTTAAVFSAMLEKGLICDGRICAWDKRQPKREREDNSAARVRQFREKQRRETQTEATEAQDSASVTPCNASVTPPEQNREEQTREEYNTPPTPHSDKQEAGTSLLSMCAPSASPSGGCTPIGVQTNGRKKAYSDDFEKFWEKYPRKVNKGAAWKAWQKAKKSGILPDVESLIEALRWRQLEPDWEKDGGKYIPHAATWLNASGWEDEGCKAPEIPQDDPREMRANEIYVKHGVHASPQCVGDAARNIATYKSVIAVIRDLREEGLSDYEPYHANLVHWLRTNGLLDDVNLELGWTEG